MPALAFTPEQRKMIRDSFANGASDQEFEMLMAVAVARNLNPLLRQIHFIPRKTWDARNECDKWVWAYQVSIDGFRAIADRTGKYDGQDEPEFEIDPKIPLRPLVARVKVYRKDIGRAFVGTARYSEFVQTKKGGDATAMWAKSPFNMLAKCAEAAALRKAFPEDLGGLHTEDEIAQEEAEEKRGGAPTGFTIVPAGQAAPAAASQPQVTPEQLKLKAENYCKLLDAASTKNDFISLFDKMKVEPDYAEFKVQVRDAYQTNRARLWPTLPANVTGGEKPAAAAPAATEKPEEKPAAPAPPPVDKAFEEWAAKVSFCGADEAAGIWKAMNDHYQGNVPVALVERFSARFPDDKSDGAGDDGGDSEGERAPGEDG